MSKKKAIDFEVEHEQLVSACNHVNDISVNIDEVVQEICSKYSKPLDDYMSFVRECLQDINNPPTALELDEMVMTIPMHLYYLGEATERIGIKEDIAKALYNQAYNKAYDAATGTVGDKTAVSELSSQMEYLSHTVYQRAYKQIKLKYETAMELLSSIKKVVTRRMTEYELSRQGGR